MSRRSPGNYGDRGFRSSNLAVPRRDLWEAIRTEARLLDLLVLAAIPAMLISVYMLPSSMKLALVFEYTEPTVLTAFTSHFVHFSPIHLFVNVAGYVLVVTLGYLLALSGERRRQFFMVSLTFILAFPFGLSALNLLWEWPGVGFGFSGVVMAFVGYLPLALLSVLGNQFGLPVDQRQSNWLFLIVVAIAAFTALSAPQTIPLAAIAAMFTIAFVWRVIRDLDYSSLTQVKNTVATAGTVELTVLGVVVLLSYPFVAFSSDLLVGGGILNVYTHGLGLCFGYMVTYIGVLSGLFDVEPVSPV